MVTFRHVLPCAFLDRVFLWAGLVIFAVTSVCIAVHPVDKASFSFSHDFKNI